MAGETVITVVGNITADPELRYTSSGLQVVNFTIASSTRTFDRNANDWKAGNTLYLRCSAWREFADNVAESLQKGMRVIAQGRLVQRDYQGNDGTKRVSYELEIDEVGPSLRFASASVTRNQQGGFSSNQGGGAPAPQAPVAADPWENEPAPSDPSDLPF
jgi:single-strand DNA-binding protein